MIYQNDIQPCIVNLARQIIQRVASIEDLRGVILYTYLFTRMINCTLTEKAKSTLPEKKEEESESSWEKLIKGIIRPPRSDYKQKALGSKAFILNETKYERMDLQIDHQGKQLKLTVYQPEYKNQWIILYLHGNSSSRLECTSIIKFLPFKFSLASFDFIGCGLNTEDERISLGVRESEQVETVVKRLERQNWNVILWGRSMGAATALKYGKAPIIVADSSFHSFRSLCKEKVLQNSPEYLPNCFVDCLFPCVFYKLRCDIEEKGGYDIEQLDIVKDVKKISPSTMIIFLSGDEDKLIDKNHSERLYNAFKGKKQIEIFKGTHNTKRPEETIKIVMKYIQSHLVPQSSFKTRELLEDEIIVGEIEQ